MNTRPDILLAHSHYLDEDPAEQRIMTPYAPLGILYLSSFLKHRGHRVEVFDGTFLTPAAFDRAIDSMKPRTVGISCNLGTRRAALRMIAAARARGLFTILGGPEPVNYPGEYLSHGADCIVVGEGEQTLDQLLREGRDFSPEDLGRIPGIAFPADSQAVARTKPRSPLKRLSDLPWPDRQAVDIGQYLTAWRSYHGYGSVSLICARGCPYRCSWCSHSVFGRTHRRREPPEVADEVEHIRTTYSPDALWFGDDVFNMDTRWLREFRNEMIRRQLCLPFECTCRADLMDQQVVELLAELQCKRVWIGAESGSQRVLSAMKRDVTAEQAREAARLARSAGLGVGTFIMLGYDGESLEDIEATVDHLREMGADSVLTTLAYPIKGTEYFNSVSDRVTDELPWALGSDRDLRVRGKYPDDFYELGKRWVNAELELLQLRRGLKRRPLASVRASLRRRWNRHRTRRRACETESARGNSNVTPAVSAFDAAAVDYDAAFTNTRLGQCLRQRVWKCLAQSIPPGSAVLELNGGTGEDACWLAERGATVTCTDASRFMLDVAARKIAERGLQHRASLQTLDLNDLPSRAVLAGPYDAVVSNFGGVNCVLDRRRLAEWLAARTRPGTPVVLIVMGPFCPWEMVALALTHPTHCLRRWRRGGVVYASRDGVGVRVFYPSPARLAAEFRPWFQRLRLTGLGVFLPPTQWGRVVERPPHLFGAVCALEQAVAGYWPATWLNDHYILELRRRE